MSRVRRRGLLRRLLLLPVLLGGVADAAFSQAGARVVTLGGAVTETVEVLGAGARIVGYDRTSLAPAAAPGARQLGAFRSISVEGVLALRPTLVLAVDGAGPPSALVQLRNAGVRVVPLPAAESLAGAVARVRVIAEALGVPARGDSLARAMSRDVTAAAARAQAQSTSPRVLAVYARGAGTLFVAGEGTGFAEMLRLANARNAAGAMEGFVPLTAEAVIAAAPDIVLVPERGLASIGGREGLRGLPGIAQTPAGRADRIVTVDDHLLLGFGPRMAEGVARLARALHPALAALR